MKCQEEKLPIIEVECGCGLHVKIINGRCGLFDKKNRQLLSCSFQAIKDFDSQGYAWVKKKDKWGLLDTETKYRIKLRYENVGDFINGACWVQLNGLWGRIDYDGNEVTPFIYQGRYALKEMLVVGEDGHLGAIGPNGEETLPKKYEKIEEQNLRKAGASCSIGCWYDNVSILCAVNDDGYEIIDRQGHPILDGPVQEMYCDQRCSEFRYMYHVRDFCYFHNMMILARNPKSENDKPLLGLYDVKQERLVLPIIYDRIVCDFYNPWFDVAQYVLAYREGKAVLIDRNGKETMPLEYEQIDYKELPEGEYLIPAYKDGLWGYINAYGTLKIPCRYLMAGQFNEGKAVVYYASIRGNVRMVDYTKGRMEALLIDHHGNVIEKCEDDDRNCL